MKIGNKHVVFSETLLIPDGESAEFIVTPTMAPPFPVVLRVLLSDPQVGDHINWNMNDGSLTLTIGIEKLKTGTTGEFVRFTSTHESKKGVFMATEYSRFGKLTTVFLQILIEE